MKTASSIKKYNMAKEKLSEAVSKFPVQYKSDKFLEDRNKKLLAREDVAQEANFEDGGNFLL